MEALEVFGRTGIAMDELLNDFLAETAELLAEAAATIVAWEADPAYDEQAGEEWLFLKPGKWNAHIQYAWRYDPCELTPQGAARPPPRAPRLDPVDPWVTDDEYDPSDDFE